MVQKESAAIRASFREESGDSNVRYDPTRPPQTPMRESDLQIGGTMSPNFSTCSPSENEPISARLNVSNFSPLLGLPTKDWDI